MKLRMIFTIVALGVCLGWSARQLKDTFFPEPIANDATNRLLGEK